MRIYNSFILILGAILLLTTVILSIGGEKRLDLYFSIYLVEYLTLSLLFVHLNPRARRVLNILLYILLPGFALIVALKVAEILWGFKL